MNIQKDSTAKKDQVNALVTRGLTPEEAARLLQISPHQSWNGRREHQEVRERLLKFQETLRAVDPVGLDELAYAPEREDQRTIARYYVFWEVIENLSKTDTVVLAEYSLWVFYGTEIAPVIEAPASEDTFGSLENIFGTIVFEK